MTLPTLSIASLFKYSALISLGILLPFMILISVCVVAFLRKKMAADTPLLIPVLVSFLAYGAIIILSTVNPTEELCLLVISHVFAWGYLAKRRATQPQQKSRKSSYRKMPIYPSKTEPALSPFTAQR